MLESGKLILKLIVKHYNPFSFSLNEYGISDTKDSQSGKSNGIITFVGVKDIYILMLFRIVIVLVCIAAFFVTYFISDGIFNSDDKKVSTKRFVVIVNDCSDEKVNKCIEKYPPLQKSL